MGTRLAQQRIHGDALLVFHHEVPWLKTVDPAQQFTLRSLLQVTLSHAPGGLPKHASHPVRPCIRTLVASILSSQAFPPRVHHREQPVPYPPHGAEQDTVADPADRHPPRASFDVATAKPDTSSPKPQPSAPSSSTDIQTQPASETPQPEAPSSPQAATLTAVPRRKRREVITTPQQQAATPSDAAAGGDSNRASTSTVYTQSRRRHYHPEGTAKGCPGCNPPPQIHAIHAYLEKKRQKQLQEEMLKQQDSAPALSQATAETRKHGAASAADNDDLVNHKRAHVDTEATDSTGEGPPVSPVSTYPHSRGRSGTLHDSNAALEAICITPLFSAHSPLCSCCSRPLVVTAPPCAIANARVGVAGLLGCCCYHKRVVAHPLLLIRVRDNSPGEQSPSGDGRCRGASVALRRGLAHAWSSLAPPWDTERC